jgi:hypothetical protein
VPTLNRIDEGLLLRDQFNRADGAPGASYDSAAGAWSVTGNKLRYEAGTPLIRVAGLDVADVVVQAVRPWGNLFDYGGWRLRHAAGGGSYIMFDMGTDSGQLRCRIYRWTGAAFVVIAVSAAINHLTYPGAWLRKTVLVGTMAYFYLDGVLVCSGAVPAASAVAGANEVWLGGSTNVANTFDDLVIASANTQEVGELPAGWKARAAGVTAVESGGTAIIDTAGASFPLAVVEVLDGADVVRHTFAGDAWGGDVFEIPAPDASSVAVSRIRRTTAYVTPGAYAHPQGIAHAFRRARARRVSTDTVIVPAAAVALAGGFYLTGLPEGPAGADGRPVVDPDLVVEVQDEDAAGTLGEWGTSAVFQTLNLWESGEYLVNVDVQIERPEGAGTVMQSYRAFGPNDRNWIRSWRLTPGTIDTPIGSGTFNFFRQVGTESLAPLVTASPLNRDADDEFAPALDYGRELLFLACITAVGGRVTTAAAAVVGAVELDVEPLDQAIGAGSILHFAHATATVTDEAPAGAVVLEVAPLLNAIADAEVAAVSPEPTADDWAAGLIWRGLTDDIEWPRKVGDVTVPVRDYLGLLSETEIRVPRRYGDPDEPVDALVVMQQIVDDNLGAGQFTIADFTVGARYLVKRYEVDGVYVLEAIQKLAEEWGGKALRQVDLAEESVIGVISVDREDETPAYTVSPHTYIEVHNINTAGKNRRTIVIGRATEYGTGRPLFKQIPAEADIDTDPLVSEFGERTMELREATTIDTQAELDAYIAAVYADVSVPPIPLRPETKFAPFARVNDVVRWLPNGLLHDEELVAAVLGMGHDGPSPGVARSQWSAGGRPKGLYEAWTRRGVQIAGVGKRASIFDLVLTHTPLGTANATPDLNRHVDHWSIWSRPDASPLVGGIPDDQYLVGDNLRPQTASVSWSVQNGEHHVLVRAYPADGGKFAELEDTIEVTGVGGGGGDPLVDVPGTPRMYRGPVDGGMQEAPAQWVNSRVDLAIEAEYVVDGESGGITAIAAGASTDTHAYAVGSHVRVRLRYVEEGVDPEDRVEGSWSAFSPEIFLPGGLPEEP